MKLRQLQRFVRHELASQDQTTLEAHLAECECCTQIAEDLRSEPLEIPEAIAGGPQTAAEQTTQVSPSPVELQEWVEPASSERFSLVTDDEAGDVLLQGGHVRRRISLATVRRLKRYEVLEELGSGGFGSVYRAQHRDTGREYAIKVVHFTRARALCVTEAKRSARVNHPNVLHIDDVVHEPELALDFLVMQLMAGGNLKAWCDKHEVTPGLASDLMQQASRGLRALHRQNVLHLDIKPANILVQETKDETTNKATLLAKLADIGLLRNEIPGEEAENETLRAIPQGGTPKYMSPEHKKGGIVDDRADIFSLGATIYDLLLPKSSSTQTTIEDDPDIADRDTPLCELRKDVSPAFSAVVMKCLAPKPEHRYQHIDELIDDLERYHDHRPVLAYQYNRFEKFRLRVARDPLAYSSLMIVGILTLLLGTAFLDKWNASAREHDINTRLAQANGQLTKKSAELEDVIAEVNDRNEELLKSRLHMAEVAAISVNQLLKLAQTPLTQPQRELIAQSAYFIVQSAQPQLPTLFASDSSPNLATLRDILGKAYGLRLKYQWKEAQRDDQTLSAYARAFPSVVQDRAYQIYLAIAYAHAGNVEEALAIVGKIESGREANVELSGMEQFNLGCVHAQLSEHVDGEQRSARLARAEELIFSNPTTEYLESDAVTWEEVIDNFQIEGDLEPLRRNRPEKTNQLLTRLRQLKNSSSTGDSK